MPPATIHENKLYWMYAPRSKLTCDPQPTAQWVLLHTYIYIYIPVSICFFFCLLVSVGLQYSPILFLQGWHDSLPVCTVCLSVCLPACLLDCLPRPVPYICKSSLQTVYISPWSVVSCLTSPGDNYFDCRFTDSTVWVSVGMQHKKAVRIRYETFTVHITYTVGETDNVVICR